MPVLTDVLRDARLATRLLARRPGFAAAALITLALGIGGPTAVFSLVHAVLLRPLPYAQADRLLTFRIEGHGPNGSVRFDALPAAQALQWGQQAATISGLALYNTTALTIGMTDGPVRLTGVAATPNLFGILRAQPARGRIFPADTADSRQIVLAHATWQQHFAGAADIIGAVVQVDGAGYVVTGVMPPEFAFPTPDAAFWTPLLIAPGGARGMLLPALARLAPDVTVADALAEARRTFEETGGARPGQVLSAHTLQDQLVGPVRRMLWVLLTGVGVVFLVAATNIALLLLTRGAGRERELALRLAIGASRARLVRQLAVEVAVLAGIGGIAGIGLAALGLDTLVALAPPEVPRLNAAGLNVTVLLFAACLTCGAAFAFGVLSIGRVLRPAASLRALAAEGTRARTSRSYLKILAVAEVALTMVLLVGAALLLRSFMTVLLVDQGFQPRGALAMQFTLPASRFATPQARLDFHTRLLERLRSVPVEAAGLAVAMPNRQPSGRFDYNPVGAPIDGDPLAATIAEVRTVSEGFFEAMGMPLLSGRGFRAEDEPGAEPVMVISDRLARQHFPDRAAVGQMLYSGTGDRRVIGVVGDVRPAAAGAEPGPAAYLPLRQDALTLQWFASATLVVRGRDAAGQAAAFRELLRSLDADVVPYNVRTLSDEVGRLVATPRFSAALLAGFAIVALVLAMVGVYGVLGHVTAQRTHEMGVRVALGATPRGVRALVLRDAAWILGGGLVLGLTAAIWLARGFAGLLHDTAPADPAALATVAGLLAVAGLAAAWLPARRATRINVLDALRHD